MHPWLTEVLKNKNKTTETASVSRDEHGTLTGQLLALAGDLQAEAAVSAAQSEFEVSAVSRTEVRQSHRRRTTAAWDNLQQAHTPQQTHLQRP